MDTHTWAPPNHDAADPPWEVVTPIEALPATEYAHEFVGAEHGDVPFSIILVEAPTGAGPQVHRHPYAEVFVVAAGRARFRLGDDELEVGARHVVVARSGIAHGFTSIGSADLRLTAIHGSSRFVTEWLAGVDSAWASKSPPAPLSNSPDPVRRRSSGCNGAQSMEDH
jgi:mannose-6-phosphate isomerase-like protein (cupin superfamily)